MNRFLDSSTLADKGYIGLGLVIPNRRPDGEKLGRNRKVVNRQINRLRSVVERVIANVKAWRVLHTGFRRPLGSYGRVFSSGTGGWCFWRLGRLLNKPQNICFLKYALVLKGKSFSPRWSNLNKYMFFG